MIFKPIKADVLRIRTAAQREAKLENIDTVVLEIGRRFSTVDASKRSVNIATISRDPEFEDTDLDDYEPWAVFRRGIALTKEGAGIFDFYIRKRGDVDRELLGNITVWIVNGTIMRIAGYPGEY